MAQLESLADAPGTSREYETIYILRPNLSNDEVADVNNRVRNIIETMGGKVLKVDNWGKRRLAYEVSKERKGIYLYWQYLAGAGVVDEFERNMRMLDSVIRYMTVKLDASVDPDARPSEVDEETYEKAANTAADEEDLFLQRSSEEGSESRGYDEEAVDASSDDTDDVDDEMLDASDDDEVVDDADADSDADELDAPEDEDDDETAAELSEDSQDKE